MQFISRLKIYINYIRQGLDLTCSITEDDTILVKALLVKCLYTSSLVLSDHSDEEPIKHTFPTSSLKCENKKCLKISKVATFERDWMKSNKDIAPQSQKILKTFVWWGASLGPHHTNVCKIWRFCGAISSPVSAISFSNSARLLI